MPPERHETPQPSSLFPDADRRDLAAVERACNETLRQIEFLRRSGAGDLIRWGLIADRAWLTWRIAAKADRRAAKANGWFEFRWRLPRGYA